MRAIAITNYTFMFHSFIVIFLGHFRPRRKGAMRLSLCEAPTRETRSDHVDLFEFHTYHTHIIKTVVRERKIWTVPRKIITLSMS